MQIQPAGRGGGACALRARSSTGSYTMHRAGQPRGGGGAPYVNEFRVLPRHWMRERKGRDRICKAASWRSARWGGSGSERSCRRGVARMQIMPVLGAWFRCKYARGRFPPPARQASPRRFKRRRACAERRNRDLVCYTTALRSPRPVPPGAPLPAAPPAPPGRPRLRHERGPAAQRFPGERPVPARGARSRGTPAAVLASPRAGPGLAVSPPPVTTPRGPCGRPH